MAYTLKFLQGASFELTQLVESVLPQITTAVKEAGFVIGEIVRRGWDVRVGEVPPETPKRKRGQNREGYVVEFNRIRLTKPKPYCGQHPGPCAVTGRRKPRMTYLEWDDWVRFHGVINDVLDTALPDGPLTVDVWSTPLDIQGRMWIRLGSQRRINYDWSEQGNGYGQPVRIWNKGTPDQFMQSD